MNTYGGIRNKKRRKTQQERPARCDLNISKIKNNHRLRYSNTSTKKKDLDNNNVIKNKMNNSDYFFLSKNKSKNPTNIKSTSLKKISYYNPMNNKVITYNNFEPKRKSLGLLQTNTQLFFDKYDMDNNTSYKLPKKQSSNNENNNYSVEKLDSIEKNIKNAINNMKKEIEKKDKDMRISTTILPKITRKTMISCNNLKLSNLKRKTKKPKNKLQISFNDGINTNDIDFSFKTLNTIRRSKSFNLNEEAKKRILKIMKQKIYKNHLLDDELNVTQNEDEDKSDIESTQGFSIDPNSNFIFVFDLLLIFANFFSFIFIPLAIANNKDIREKDHVIKEIINYSIDIIFLFDLILSFFRGYYDFEMVIVRNNKILFFHYLKKYFITDLLESIPFYSIIKICNNSKENIYSYNTSNSLNIFYFLLFIKPFKIFKIARKRQNKALEDFYSYLSESYYLEESVKFLIYFIIFFLFIHLLVCLHLFCSLLNYPNWILHSNMMNYNFIEKYVTSFYFMITTMTTVGYGDIVCISLIERIYHIILLAIGTLLYTFLVSKISNYLSDKSHEQIKLNKDLDILENIRVTYPTMPYKLYFKIKNHLQTIFAKRKKTGISLLINGVPDAIKNELLLKIYSNVINGFTFFKNINNSNFILQVLTSFIPIVSKKEEIIILEKEIIKYIVLVKDGRLTMEIAIDLNDPYNSIQKYIEVNFIGISKQEELKIGNNFANRVNSIMMNCKKNYDDLKNEIDNFLLDNQKESKNVNNQLSDHGISVDLGRIDFHRKEIDEKKKENFQIIKIIDIRKNEYYGDIHVFSEQPSPFTVKTKSRIAELFLLPKHDAINISNTFSNIWKRIQGKSFHNLVSIKKLTFRTLKKYYNMNIYNRKNKEYNVPFNLDATKNSEISFLENSKLNITNNLIAKNLNHNINKSFNINANSKNYISSYSNHNNNSIENNINKSNKNKLSIPSNQNKISSEESFDKDLNFSSDSDNNSIFKFPKNISKEEKFKNPNKRNSQNLDEIFSFKNGIEDGRLNLLSPQNLRNANQLNNFWNLNNFKAHNVLDPKNISQNQIPINSLKKKYNRTNTQQTNKNKILTLDDLNRNFSQKIKKMIKKRKKFRKLKELFRLQRLKINKNIYELHIKRNSLVTNILNQNLANINFSFSSSNKKEFSQIIDSTNTSVSKTNFDFDSLQIISTQSFEIKSSYKNFNSLSKGEMVKNKNYKNFLEKLIIKYLNNISNESLKSILSFISKLIKKERTEKKEIKKQSSLHSNNIESIVEKSNEEEISSEKEVTSTIVENHFNNSNRAEKSNLLINKFSQRKIGKISNDNKRAVMKNKNSSKFLERGSFQLNTFKNYYHKYSNIQNKKLIKNFTNSNSSKEINLFENKIFKTKESNKDLKSKENKASIIPILKSYEKRKYNKSKNENEINSSGMNMIKVNKFPEENSNKCIIY